MNKDINNKFLSLLLKKNECWADRQGTTQVCVACAVGAQSVGRR